MPFPGICFDCYGNITVNQKTGDILVLRTMLNVQLVKYTIKGLLLLKVLIINIRGVGESTILARGVSRNCFTHGMDVNQTTGDVYFTDTSCPHKLFKVTAEGMHES